jgi:hypothetical protein
MTAQKPRKPQRPRREPRGKTYKQQTPHPTRVEAGIVKGHDDPLDDLVEQLKELRDLVKLDPTTDAVKASLRAMAKIRDKFEDAAEADEAALQALERCDWMTEAMLRRARFLRGGPAGGGIADRLKADASDALKLLRKSRGGKPGDIAIKQAALAMLRIWFAETGDLEPSIGHDPRRKPPTTPIVLRAIDLFERVDGKKRDGSTVARMLRSARRPEKIR